jgi:hypothetical protein
MLPAVATSQQPRPRGAPRGNLNAFKNGRYSVTLRQQVAAAQALHNLTLAAGRPDVAEYLLALRWSRRDRALLELAVAKQAVFVRYRLRLLHALRNGEVPPDIPPAPLSRYENAAYVRYLEERRALLPASTRDLDPTVDPLDEEARLARQALEDWLLASSILGPEAPHAFGLTPDQLEGFDPKQMGQINQMHQTDQTGQTDLAPSVGPYGNTASAGGPDSVGAYSNRPSPYPTTDHRPSPDSSF